MASVGSLPTATEPFSGWIATSLEQIEGWKFRSVRIQGFLRMPDTYFRLYSFRILFTVPSLIKAAKA
jgi:hypothetical protein